LTCEGTSRRLKTTTSSGGTECYHAPELLRYDEKNAYNNKVDVWSMGCVLYELATGDKPFKTDWAVIEYYRFDEVPSLPFETPVAEGYQTPSTLVANMLKCDPSFRPNARDLYRTFCHNSDLAIIAEKPKIDSFSLNIPLINHHPESSLVKFANSSVSPIFVLAFNNPSMTPLDPPRASITLIDAETHTVRPLLTKSKSVDSVAFGRDKSGTIMLATLDILDCNISVWNPRTNELLKQHQFKTNVRIRVRGLTAKQMTWNYSSLVFNHVGNRLAWRISFEDIVICSVSSLGEYSNNAPNQTTLSCRDLKMSVETHSLQYHEDDVRLFIATSGMIIAFNTIERTRLFQVQDPIISLHKACLTRNLLYLRYTSASVFKREVAIFSKVDTDTGDGSREATLLSPVFDISACGTWIASQESDSVVVRLLCKGTVIQKIRCRAFHIGYVKERCYALCENRVWIIDCGQEAAVQIGDI
jgi:serine/threonine protein kinase